MASMTIIWQSWFDWWIPFTLIAVFLRYIDPCIYYLAFYICLFQMRFSQQIVKEFKDLAHSAMFALIDFRRSDFAFAFWILSVQTSPFLSLVQILDIQTSPLLAYYKLDFQNSPSYGSNVQTSSASNFLAP